MNKEEKEQDIRLDQTKKIFGILAYAIKNESISYRNLIYDKLHFYGHYDELMDGLIVTNAIVDLEEKNEKTEKLINYLQKFIPVDTDTIILTERQREYIISILKGGNEDV